MGYAERSPGAATVRYNTQGKHTLSIELPRPLFSRTRTGKEYAVVQTNTERCVYKKSHQFRLRAPPLSGLFFEKIRFENRHRGRAILACDTYGTGAGGVPEPPWKERCTYETLAAYYIYIRVLLLHAPNRLHRSSDRS